MIGQHQAIVAVSKSIRRARAGIRTKRPSGSFIFLGPSGVQDRAGAHARRVPLRRRGRDDPGRHVGVHGEALRVPARRLASRLRRLRRGGQLTEAVRRKPYSVVLLDEIEKAHPDVFNILLQILEDGKLTGAQGRKVDFRNTIVVMTSNIGAASISKNVSLGFSIGDETGLSTTT